MQRNLSVGTSMLILVAVVLAIAAAYAVQWGRYAFVTAPRLPRNRMVVLGQQRAWDAHRTGGYDGPRAELRRG